MVRCFPSYIVIFFITSFMHSCIHSFLHTALRNLLCHMDTNRGTNWILQRLFFSLSFVRPFVAINIAYPFLSLSFSCLHSHSLFCQELFLFLDTKQGSAMWLDWLKEWRIGVTQIRNRCNGRIWRHQPIQNRPTHHSSIGLKCPFVNSWSIFHCLHDIQGGLLGLIHYQFICLLTALAIHNGDDVTNLDSWHCNLAHLVQWFVFVVGAFVEWCFLWCGMQGCSWLYEKEEKSTQSFPLDCLFLVLCVT